MTPDDLSTDTLRSLLEQSTDCVKLLDRDGRITWMNRNGCHVMEIGDFDTVEGTPWPEVWPTEAKDTVRAALEDAARGSSFRFRAPCPTMGGTMKTWDVTVMAVRDATDTACGYLAISRDVSDLQPV